MIESDPGVFTELVSKIGVKGIQFEEIYSLDEQSFLNVREECENVYGLIFLFKWSREFSSIASPALYHPPGLFFAKQVVMNACATLAILSVLLNCPEVEIGSNLECFKDFTKDFDATLKGMSIGHSDSIREAHNSFKGHLTFELTHDEQGEDSDAFHFVSYVPFENSLWELDGLQNGPVRVGSCGSEGNPDWMALARQELIRRIEKIQLRETEGTGKSEIRFNVLAVVPDQLLKMKAKLSKIRQSRLAASAALMSFGEDVAIEEEDIAEGEEMEEMPDMSVESLKETVLTATALIQQQQQAINTEQIKRNAWERENQRRRHDFIPFVLTSLKHLAKTGALQQAYDSAKA